MPNVKNNFQSSTKTAARPRGRPRAFSPEAALAKARGVFLRRGYAGATIDELAAEMGINRPSLYAAFHDKEALYARVVEDFGREAAVAMQAALDGSDDIEAALVAFYDAALDVYMADAELPGGCLIMTTAVTEALSTPSIRPMVAGVIAQIDALLGARLSRAKSAGHLAPGADPMVLAKIAAATLHSLAIRARAGQPRAELSAMARAAARLLAR
jgi:AcrR family transcriptional regulator